MGAKRGGRGGSTGSIRCGATTIPRSFRGRSIVIIPTGCRRSVLSNGSWSALRNIIRSINKRRPRRFWSEDGGETLGRILAIKNRAYLDRYPHDPCGFVGFFESVNDRGVADSLFDAAREWLAARHLDVIRGPANPSHNYDWGLLIRPFDMSPSFLMTYNPDYYIDLWESYGFVKAEDILTFVGHKQELSTLGKEDLHGGTGGQKTVSKCICGRWIPDTSYGTWGSSCTSTIRPVVETGAIFPCPPPKCMPRGMASNT